MKRIAFAACLGLLVGGCHADASVGSVDLAAPASTVPVTLDHVRRDGAPETVAGVTLQRYTFEAGAAPTLAVAPARAWSAGDELHVQIQNAMPWAVTLTIELDGATPDQQLHVQVGLPPGPAQTLVIPLHAV
ncbi:MAG TPA: beta-agarase, partial [Rhodanobacter sp.]|nr:beta-agarase [Rhodanobacter sp.]